MAHIVLFALITVFSIGAALAALGIYLYIKKKKKSIRDFLIFHSAFTLLVTAKLIQFYFNNIVSDDYGIYIGSILFNFSIILMSVLIVIITNEKIEYKLKLLINTIAIIVGAVFTTLLFSNGNLIKSDIPSFLFLAVSWSYSILSFYILRKTFQDYEIKFYKTVMKISIIFSMIILIPNLIPPTSNKFLESTFFRSSPNLSFILFYILYSVLYIFFLIRVNDSTGKNFEKKIYDSSIFDSFNLTKKELEVIKLLLKGKENKEIASELNISLPTVKKHVQSIFRKCKAKNRYHLITLF